MQRQGRSNAESVPTSSSYEQLEEQTIQGGQLLKEFTVRTVPETDPVCSLLRDELQEDWSELWQSYGKYSSGYVQANMKKEVRRTRK